MMRIAVKRGMGALQWEHSVEVGDGASDREVDEATIRLVKVWQRLSELYPFQKDIQAQEKDERAGKKREADERLRKDILIAIDKGATISDLVAALDLPPGTGVEQMLRKHLNILIEEGTIASHRDGRALVYTAVNEV